MTCCSCGHICYLVVCFIIFIFISACHLYPDIFLKSKNYISFFLSIQIMNQCVDFWFGCVPSDLNHSPFRLRPPWSRRWSLNRTRFLILQVNQQNIAKIINAAHVLLVLGVLISLCAQPSIFHLAVITYHISWCVWGSGLRCGFKAPHHWSQKYIMAASINQVLLASVLNNEERARTLGIDHQ